MTIIQVKVISGNQEKGQTNKKSGFRAAIYVFKVKFREKMVLKRFLKRQNWSKIKFGKSR